MKKTVIFSGVFGVLLMGMANADEVTPVSQPFPADGQHPLFSGETDAALISAAKPRSLRDEATERVKVATTHYVDVTLNAVNADVQQLSVTANGDKQTVDTNEASIASMQDNRQVRPATDSCDTSGNAGEGMEFVACGYIAPDGGDAISDNASDYMNRANYSWVKIIAPVNAPANNQEEA